MFRYSSESLESNIRCFIYFNFNSGNFTSVLANNYGGVIYSSDGASRCLVKGNFRDF